MGIEIVIEEFNPVLLNDHGRGKFILCKNNSERAAEKCLLFYANALDGQVKLHIDIARKYQLPEENVLGGAEMTMEHQPDNSLVLHLYEFSARFGGIPAEVVGALIPALEDYLKNFDYEKAEREVYEQRFALRKRHWDNYQAILRNQETDKALVEEALKSRWNHFLAWFAGVPAEDYVRDKLKVKMPEKPQPPLGLHEEPKYAFQPSMRAENITIAIPRIFIEPENIQKWENYLASD